MSRFTVVLRIFLSLPRLWRLTRRVVLWNGSSVLNDPEMAERATPGFEAEFAEIKEYVRGSGQ